MSLKVELGAALRAIRQQRQLSYEHLAGGSLRTTVGQIERAQSGVSFDKLADIAQSLDFNLVALIALCVSTQQGVPAEKVLHQASVDLQDFLATGGAELIQSQLAEGKLVNRPSGPPVRVQNRTAVLALKAEGKTPTEAVRLLGLSRTSVNRYWRSES